VGRINSTPTNQPSFDRILLYGGALWPSYRGEPCGPLSTFLQAAISSNRKKSIFRKFRNFVPKKWAVQLPKFLPDGPWGPRIMKAKNCPTPEIWGNWGEKFSGVGPRPSGQYCRGRLKPVKAFTAGPSVIQNRANIGPLGLTVWSQWRREKVEILKCWVLRPIWWRCSPGTWPSGGIFFAIYILGKSYRPTDIVQLEPTLYITHCRQFNVVRTTQPE